MTALAIHPPSETPEVDLYEMSQADPEQAMMLADTTLKKQVTDARMAWIISAQLVTLVYETEIWKHHPQAFKTFNEWTMQEDIDITPSVSSDMRAVVKYAPKIQETCGINLFDVIQRAGPGKIRALVPHIRSAAREGTLHETITPLLHAVEHETYRGILDMVGTQSVRTQPAEFAAYYNETSDGVINISFRDLSYEQLETLTTMLKITSWFDAQSNTRIANPLDNDVAYDGQHVVVELDSYRVPQRQSA